MKTLTTTYLYQPTVGQLIAHLRRLPPSSIVHFGISGEGKDDIGITEYPSIRQVELHAAPSFLTPYWSVRPPMPKT